MLCYKRVVTTAVGVGIRKTYSVAYGCVILYILSIGNPYLSTLYLLHVTAPPGPLSARINPVEFEKVGCYVYHKNNYAFTNVNYTNLFTYLPTYLFT